MTAALGVELKPCPFCGEEAAKVVQVIRRKGVNNALGDDSRFTVMCDHCGAKTSDVMLEASAKVLWNARAALASPPGAPVAWMRPSIFSRDYANVTTAEPDIAEDWRKEGLVVTPLYASQASPPAQEGKAQVIDLDAESWKQIKQAASESTWMPPEYFSNHWVSDVCEFLRNGHPGAPTPPSENERERLGDELAAILGDPLSSYGMNRVTITRKREWWERIVRALRQADAPVGWKDEAERLLTRWWHGELQDFDYFNRMGVLLKHAATQRSAGSAE